MTLKSSGNCGLSTAAHQYQPIPSKGRGRHVRDTTWPLRHLTLLFHLPAWSFLSKIVNLLRAYTQRQLIIHAFNQCVKVWLVSLVSMVDTTTRLAFKTWRKSTDLASRVWIHKLLFVLTGWWLSLICLNIQPYLQHGNEHPKTAAECLLQICLVKLRCFLQ